MLAKSYLTPAKQRIKQRNKIPKIGVTKRDTECKADRHIQRKGKERKGRDKYLYQKKKKKRG